MANVELIIMSQPNKEAALVLSEDGDGTEETEGATGLVLKEEDLLTDSVCLSRTV